MVQLWYVQKYFNGLNMDNSLSVDNSFSNP